MARALLPTDAELATLTTLNEARAWCGLAQDTWNVLSGVLGDVPNLRVLATLPMATLQAAVSRSRIPATAGAAEREFSAVEIIQVAILWRVARQAHGLLDIDPLIPQDTAVTGPATAVAEPAPRKKGEDECSSRSIG